MYSNLNLISISNSVKLHYASNLRLTDYCNFILLYSFNNKQLYIKNHSRVVRCHSNLDKKNTIRNTCWRKAERTKNVKKYCSFSVVLLFPVTSGDGEPENDPQEYAEGDDPEYYPDDHEVPGTAANLVPAARPRPVLLRRQRRPVLGVPHGQV